MADNVTLQAIVGGTTYNLEHASLLWEHMSGSGMTPVRRLSQRGPLQDGKSDLGFVLQPRRIDLVFYALGSTYQDHFDRRDELLEIFRPTDDPIKLRLTRPDASKRQIDVHYFDGLGFGSREHTGKNFRVPITLEAPNPLWYDPNQNSIRQELQAQDDLVFPITYPIQFASSVLNEGVTAQNIGTYKSFPIILIDGPGDNPVIENLTTGLKIELNYNLSLGEVVTIDLTPGAKTVNSDTAGNIIGALTSDSDIGDFALESAPEVVDGSNQLRLTIGSGTAEETAITVKWFDRYLGV